jgi:ATP-dependent Clp protease ATP-binding subunit ClpA
VLTPAHVLKEMLEDRDQLAVNLIRASGGRPELAVQGVDTALGKIPKVSGSNTGLRLEQAGAKLFQDAEAGAKAGVTPRGWKGRSPSCARAAPPTAPMPRKAMTRSRNMPAT